MPMTIKQLADQLGVSKTAIRNCMDDDFRAKYTAKDSKGVITITPDGCKLISENYRKTTENSGNEIPQTPENAVSGDMVALLQTTIETLRDQLAEKDKQLAEKDRQLKDLTETVKAQAQSINGAQALHAGTMQQIAGEVVTDAPPAQTEPTKKRRFFCLFGKKGELP